MTTSNKGEYLCDVCGMPGRRNSAMQKRHAGWCQRVQEAYHKLANPGPAARRAYIERRLAERRLEQLAAGPVR